MKITEIKRESRISTHIYLTFLNFILFFKLYIIVLVLPNIIPYILKIMRNNFNKELITNEK